MTNTISAEDARRALQMGAIALDVREPAETASGTVTGAVCIPLGNLAEAAKTTLPDLYRPIVAYCASGIRSARAADLLTDLGYAEVRSLDGGYAAWTSAGGSVTRSDDPALTPRYSRHVLLPDVGLDGQRALLNARVAVVGAGGLGSPVLLYLAAAGVGTLRLIDDDVVDESNLQRQIIHTTARIGTPKVESAAAAIAAQNPDVHVEPMQVRITTDNAKSLLGGFDVVIDGTDSFDTRYVVNDACLELGIPLVHGSIFRFDGQVAVFDPRQEDSPCYRCLFPAAPPADLAPSCAQAGVLGVLPGVIGSMMATEAIKLILRLGDPLVGRLLIYDALAMSTRTVKVRRNPHCPSCNAIRSADDPVGRS